MDTNELRQAEKGRRERERLITLTETLGGERLESERDRLESEREREIGASLLSLGGERELAEFVPKGGREKLG